MRFSLLFRVVPIARGTPGQLSALGFVRWPVRVRPPVRCFDVVDPGAVGVDEPPGECMVEPERLGAVGDRVGSLFVKFDERL